MFDIDRLLTAKNTILSWCYWLYETLQDVASPPYCAYCWKLLAVRIPLCSACQSRIRPLVSYDLVVSSTRFCTVHALAAYEEPLKSLIRAKQARSIMSSYHLGRLMADNMALLTITADDVLVPIPLHWQRYAWRGFNQANIIATSIARKHGATVVPLLKRVKRTQYQAEARSREDRQANVQDAFVWDVAYNVHDYAHRRLIVIDDLMTTGATLRIAVNELFAQYKTCHLTPPAIQAYVAARVVTK